MILASRTAGMYIEMGEKETAFLGGKKKESLRSNRAMKKDTLSLA